jgi:hypothetical protein
LFIGTVTPADIVGHNHKLTTTFSFISKANISSTSDSTMTGCFNVIVNGLEGNHDITDWSATICCKVGSEGHHIFLFGSTGSDV